ncbi:efflux RND transporter periplasmic adaptor subunit [Aequorivita marisscotiae]|uniref:Efflux RND transporter periplasmic adaptor subunit n=1 Tax=Aequorivita marisscotiae TaxID=3040348 RepID=A0ABY8KUJ4_9FLAO|nr:efflux RND transporter periplasmic adaptor subunit [Aequorivita sp. Ant34-E75]WGF91522.1 efflux RND transporter periplasmic adaptor subunit [Aequorivita sp. Ant34-E75]
MNYIKSLLLLSIFVLAGCNNSETESSSLAASEEKDDLIHLSKAQFKNANMEIGQLTEKPFATTIQSSGMIDVPPQSRAVVSAFAGGYIKNAPLLVGSKVAKGQRLVTIENPEFITMQQNYMETVAQLSYLNSEYERQKIMLAEKITSQKSFLRAESDYKTALARSNSLEKNLQMLNINPAAVAAGTIVSQTHIYSPIEGSVTQVFVNTGSYVSPADKIMEIINTDHIHLELKIFEKDLLQLKEEQEIQFTVPEASDDTFSGVVHLIGTSIDPNSRTSLVHGHIAEEDESNFTAGMFVDAHIVTGVEKRMALPENAVVAMDGKNYLLLIENETEAEFEIHPLAVKTGPTYNGFTAIETIDKLNANSKFITKGAFVLLQEEGGGGHSH